MRLVRLTKSGACLVSPTEEVLIASDKASASREGEIGPDPSGKDREPVAEAAEEEDMHHQPGDPGRKAALMGLERPFDSGHGGHAPDSGHIALVEVAEGGA